jgi:hypothetical protein
VLSALGVSAQHEEPRLKAMLLQALETPADGLPDALKAFQLQWDAFHKKFEEHMVLEEMEISPVARKFLNVDLMIDVSRAMYFTTPDEKWAQLIPFILNCMPAPKARRRFLHCLRWFAPERMQQ